MRPTRKGNRLPEFGYSGGHAYFVTICIAGRQRILSSVDSGAIVLSPIGILVHRLWQEIPIHHLGASLDEMVIMPDHLHGTIEIQSDTRTMLALVVGGFKSAATKQVREAGLWGRGAFWQRGYYDRVIRGVKDMDRARKYILENPFRWRG